MQIHLQTKYYPHLSKTYWASNRTKETIELSIKNSICYGLYHNNEQVGFARVLTDYATMYWLCDVIIDQAHRGKGLGKKFVQCITGCSHSGICNIVEYAKKVCNEEDVDNIIGGFHLLKPSDEQLSCTLEYLKKLKPNEVHACHCTDLHSKIALAKAVKLSEVGVGLTLEFI